MFRKISSSFWQLSNWTNQNKIFSFILIVGGGSIITLPYAYYKHMQLSTGQQRSAERLRQMKKLNKTKKQESESSK